MRVQLSWHKQTDRRDPRKYGLKLTPLSRRRPRLSHIQGKMEAVQAKIA